ncbi:MAG: amidophosphoribosyltransferase [Candidatus Gastranaerophilales bacterium]|nr:amidophosphoribosyltransferase [Candidatus Gastranaerophilales bacterium]
MKLHEECGIFACMVKNNNAFEYIKYGLSLLQHRGQESAGICAGDFDYKLIKNTGLVCEVFKNIKPLKGNFGIGHVRYSTCSNTDIINAQPFCSQIYRENAAIAHNGNVSLNVNDNDTQIIFNTLIKEIDKPPSDWTLEDISHCLIKNFANGAWSVVMALPERIIGIKDIYGFRPLLFCIAEEGMFLASEDCAFDSLKIHKIIEINAGECIEITKDKWEIKKYYNSVYTKQCVFEHIYFANPASEFFSKNVYQTRLKLGKILAAEDNIRADVVIPVMNSGLNAAIGYSEVSKIPMHLGLKRNINMRSFIQPETEKREQIAQKKYIPVKSVIKNKKIILIDDSIVRGTTMKYLTQLLYESGAKEVHIRLSAPAIINTCLWGIDIPNKEELIYNKFNSETALAEYLGAAGLKYISTEGFKKVFEPDKWCYNCFMENQKNNDFI